MTPPSRVPPPVAPICARCGTAVTGRFCAGCGADTLPRACGRCRAALSPGARFCHQCGLAAGPGDPRNRVIGWATALLLAAALVLGVFLLRRGAAPVPPPAMGSAGGAGGVPLLTGRGPDISTLTPRERFDRLYQRALSAAEAGDTLNTARFSDHALAAYRELEAVDADLRYHAAVLHAQLGDWDPALAQADSILAAHPGHLFGHLIRGTVAELRRDAGALAAARAVFLAAQAGEQRAARPEYLDHQEVLRAFRAEAETARNQPDRP